MKLKPYSFRGSKHVLIKVLELCSIGSKPVFSEGLLVFSNGTTNAMISLVPYFFRYMSPPKTQPCVQLLQHPISCLTDSLRNTHTQQLVVCYFLLADLLMSVSYFSGEVDLGNWRSSPSECLARFLTTMCTSWMLHYLLAHVFDSLVTRLWLSWKPMTKQPQDYFINFIKISPVINLVMANVKPMETEDSIVSDMSYMV